MRRRTFLSMTALGGALLGGCAAPRPDTGGVMPDEGQPHRRTWMALGADAAIWGDDLLPEVQRNLATIATTIAAFEPVTMLVRAADRAVAQQLVGDTGVELVTAELDDLWMRDTGPVFVGTADGPAGVDLNFNGWGDKQAHDRDARVAGVVADRAGVPRRRTDLVLEGGALEVDGEGTAILTESCVLNDNRNPGWTRADVEEELGHLFGIETVIWLPGIAGRDITDGHTDFYARFAGPGVVVAGLDNDPESFDHDVTRRHLDILSAATDARGRALQVEVLEGPSTVRVDDEDFAAGYVNFYVCNGAVLLPEFGDPDADPAARDTLQRLFPDREIVQLDIDGIAAGGGGIHCTTQQEPV